MSSGRPQNRIAVGATWLLTVQVVERLIGIVSVSVLARLAHTPVSFGMLRRYAGIRFTQLWRAFGE
jgi:O-antigen/teichoic acid export membrane protein